MKNKDTVIRETIRLNIIAKRKELKLTQSELANKVGLKKNTISSWEQGLSTPDIDTIVLLLQIFDMDFYTFTGLNSNDP